MSTEPSSRRAELLASRGSSLGGEMGETQLGGVNFLPKQAVALQGPLVSGFFSVRIKAFVPFLIQLQAKPDTHQLHYIKLGDSGCKWLIMPAETWKLPRAGMDAVWCYQAFCSGNVHVGTVVPAP